jgi:hypothetical protein
MNPAARLLVPVPVHLETDQPRINIPQYYYSIEQVQAQSKSDLQPRLHPDIVHV